LINVNISELNEVNLGKNNTSYLHFIASLTLHLDELTNLLENCDINFDFIGITETRLNKHKISSAVLDQYAHEDCPAESVKGGVRIYLSKKFSYLPRKDLEIYSKGELESVFVEILNVNKPNTLIGCIFRHPCTDIDKFDILYNDLLEKISHEKKQLTIMGDFNIDLLNVNTNPASERFLNLNLSNCLKPHISKPTRITSHRKTLIDNIFSNYLGMLILYLETLYATSL